MTRRLSIPVTLLILLLTVLPACNLSEETELSDPECLSDDDCEDGYCDEENDQCLQCLGDEHCPGDEICRQGQCLSGCTEFDCGDGGTCVDDDSQIHCECDEGHFLDAGICSACDCDIENGTGACESDGTCIITSCDDGYSTEDDDPATGCECGPDDWPDPVDFRDRNCDGVDGDASRAVFVSPFGDDDHDGIRTRPVRTINRAIEIASDSESRDQVFIAEGEYDELIHLQEGISLFGGYFDAGLGEWERGHEYETVISGVGLDDGHQPVIIDGVEEDLELQLLTIRADDAPEPVFFSLEYTPESSVGLTIFDNDGHLHLSHLTVETGDGAIGRPGTVGASGAAGLDGHNGHFAFSEDNLGQPGLPRSQSCPFSSAPQAGAGGRGRQTGDDAAPAEDGADAPGNDGGEGGSGGLTNIPSNCGTEQTGTSGEDGGDAAAHGADGEDGLPAAPDAFSLTTDDGMPRFLAENGEDGTDGQTGYGGGGGGGGGGTDFMVFNDCARLPGGGGGAGGNGGCGGQHGTAGQWGGASIGVVAYSTSLSVVHSEFILGDGGDGAVGGPGGNGGEGGQGGLGSEEGLGDDVDNPEDSGNGGAGSRGGHGGGGAGGNGGPSIAIFHAISDLETDDLSFELGQGGQGGEGGGHENDGHPGQEADILEAPE